MAKLKPNVKEVLVLFTMTPEQAVEAANAIVASRKQDANRVLVPKRTAVTYGALVDALEAAGITNAKLIDPNKLK